MTYIREGTSADLIEAISKVTAVVDIAIGLGEGSGMLSLKHRLEALLEPPAAGASEGRSKDAAIETEMRIWSKAIQELLAPERQEAFRDQLRIVSGGGPERSRDPWILLDPDAVARRRDDSVAEMRRAKQTSLQACARYATTGRTSHIREAVIELELAVHREEQTWTVGVRPFDCEGVVGQLSRALATLPGAASRLFVAEVRQLVAADRGDAPIGGTPSVDRRKEDQWLSRRAWAEAGNDQGFIDARFFVGELQDRYDQALKQAQASDDAERRRRADAALRLREWQTKVDAETAAAPDDHSPVDDVPAPIPPRPDLPRTPGSGEGSKDHVSDEGAMSPAMAWAVEEERARIAGIDAEIARQRQDKAQYEEDLRDPARQYRSSRVPT